MMKVVCDDYISDKAKEVLSWLLSTIVITFYAFIVQLKYSQLEIEVTIL